MYVAGIINESIVDGPGIRYTIFFQGCTHQCKGCHNPKTWSLNTGKQMSVNEIISDIKNNPYVTGFTLSGGDPFDQNISELLELVKELKKFKKPIWVYTGYTYEQIYVSSSMNPVLDYIDVLVDGPFIEELKDLTLKFRGSSNQRLIKVQTSRPNNINLW